MMMKAISVIGWICFALDLAFVIALFVIRDAGSDAAGRGLGRGWAVILLPILLAAGALLLWGTRSGSRVGIVAGTFFVAIPFLMLAQSKVNQMREDSAYRAQKATYGQFASAELREIATRIDQADTTGLRALLDDYQRTGKTLDYAERDAAGETILGFAVARASDYMDTTPDKLVALQMLLAHGVPYAADAVTAGGDWNRDLIEGGSERYLAVIATALEAGANANATGKYDSMPAFFNSNATLGKLQLLAKHGADFHVLTPAPERHSAIMRALRFSMFPEALFFLQHGVDPAYVAPDGQTAQSEFDRVVTEARGYQKPVAAGEEELRAALAAARSNPPTR
jgi:hypothetical protein